MVSDPFTVVYDTCVLYPAQVRSFLMWLVLSGLFRARWSERIHDERMRNAQRDRPDIPIEKLQRIRALIDSHVLNALVTGCESLIPGIRLPDPDDRHVVAVAIRSGAGAIVTTNPGDFPVDCLEPFGLEAIHPNDFICNLADLDPVAVCKAAREHRVSLRDPPKSVREYLDMLIRVGLTITVSFLREHSEDI